MEVRSEFSRGWMREEILITKEQEGTFWCDGNSLYVGSDGYMSVCILKNP